MWTEKLNITDLRVIDASIRDILNRQNAKYKLQSNWSLYLPRSKGGRGLKQVEFTYKATRIKAAMKILTDQDPQMILVKKFDKLRMEKGRSSIIRDAISFSRDDFHSEFIALDEGFIFKYGDPENRDTTSDSNKVSRILKKTRISDLERDRSESVWQGVTFNARNQDPDLIRNQYYQWNTKWKDCPVEVVNDIHSIILQIVPTLCFKNYRGQGDKNNTKCRLCHKSVENIPHILNNCEHFLPNFFKRRHDKILRYIYSNLLVKYGFRSKINPWYIDENVKPSYENEKVNLYWDIPEYLGYDDERDDKLLRPDGKLILKDQSLMLILEMSVPWITNREEKFQEKENKYRDLIASISVLHPTYRVEQVTLIVDSLGGYSQSLVDALKRLDFNLSERSRILHNIQKIVLTEACHIVNRFKQLTRV